MLKRSFSDLQIVAAMTAGLLVCSLIVYSVYSFVQFSEYDLSLFREKISGMFHPEPRERLAFFLSLVSLPITFALVFYFSRYVKGYFSSRSKWYVRILVSALLLSALGAILSFLVFPDYSSYEWPKPEVFFASTLLLISLGITFLIFINGRYLKKHVKYARFIAVSLALLAAGYIGSFRIFNASSPIFETAAFHFQTVLLSVYNVTTGGAVLVDTKSQYGLYPHFLEPLFLFMPLNVQILSTVFAILTIVSFVGFVIFLSQTARSSLLLLLGSISVFTFNRYWNFQNMDVYFQYQPIRTLFPAFLLAVLPWYFSKDRNLKSSIAVSLVLSAGTLWNFDSGIVALLTWVLTLGYNTLRRNGLTARTILDFLKIGALTFASFFVTVILFSFYIFLRYDVWPDWTGFLEFNKIYYILGFYMYPMVLNAFWWIPIGFYAVLLALTMRSLQENKKFYQAETIFGLAVLGFGLFTYYQGNTTNGNLINAAYPSIFAVTILADRSTKFFSSHSWRELKREWASSVLRLGLGTMSAFLIVHFTTINVYGFYERNFLSGSSSTGIVPKLGFDKYEDSASFKSEWTAELRLIREVMKDLKKGDPAIILSPADFYWASELQITMPKNYGGIFMVLTKDDLNRILQEIRSRRSRYVIFDARMEQRFLRTELEDHKSAINSNYEKIYEVNTVQVFKLNQFRVVPK